MKNNSNYELEHVCICCRGGCNFEFEASLSVFSRATSFSQVVKWRSPFAGLQSLESAAACGDSPRTSKRLWIDLSSTQLHGSRISLTTHYG